MYICLDGINAETLRKVKSAIKEIVDDDIEVRTVGSIYKEIARIEIESTIGAEIDDEQMDQLSRVQMNKLLEDLSLELAMDFEDTVFQEMCDRSNEVIKRHSEENLFDLEYLENICN